MAPCGRKVWAALVWLTALMTLLSSLPHFDCRCPGGRVKRFCVGLYVSACCCGGSCCSSAPPGRRVPGPLVPSARSPCPCCTHKPQAPGGKAGTAERDVGSASCVKTLAAAPLLAMGEVRTDGDEDPPTESLPPQPAPGGFAAACVPPGNNCHVGPSPPPINLLILLRHLLI